MRDFVPRFLWVLAYFAVITAIGTLGYRIVEGWGFHDALYMTVTTVTAVGYEEVNPLSTAGRNFTMALLGAGILGIGLWFGLLTSLIVELDLRQVFRGRREMKALASIQDHIVICGAGRTGRQVLQELAETGRDLVVIEIDRERVAWVREHFPDLLVIEGDATQNQSLEEAGIDRASGLMACLSSDTDNLFLCLSARDLRPGLTIVARAYEEESMGKLYLAGATHVVSPNVSGAVRMASVMVRPTVLSFLDVATRSSDLSLRLEEVTVSEDSAVAGRTLADAKIPQETGLIVIAVRQEGSRPDEFVFNPVASTRLDPGDDLIVLGRPEQIEELRRYMTD